jgi:hypothetical protein
MMINPASYRAVDHTRRVIPEKTGLQDASNGDPGDTCPERRMNIGFPGTPVGGPEFSDVDLFLTVTH